MKSIRTATREFCENSQGQLTLFQTPNIPLIAWAIFLLLSKIPALHSLTNIFAILSLVSLAIWAVLELFRGDSNFRRLLGAVMLTAITISLLR